MDYTDDDAEEAQHNQYQRNIDRYNFFNEELQRLKLGFETKLDYIEHLNRNIDDKINALFDRIKYMIELIEVTLYQADDEDSANEADN